MCFQYIVSQQRSYIKCRWQRNLAHMCVLSAPLLLYPSLSLWASGTVSLRSTKQILFPLLLPKLHLASWAWLRPGYVQKTHQPLMHSLTNSPPPPPPRQVRKGGGTDILISNNWKYSTYTPLCNNIISCYYCHGSGKTPCCSHLSPSWAIGHLPPSHSPRMAVHL